MSKVRTKFFSNRETKYGRRHRPGEMNQTEAAYAQELQLRKLAGEIVEWHFEAMTFKLADDVRFTPDFVVFHLDTTMELVDVKGSAFAVDPKSVVKIKVAAEKFFWFKWSQAVKNTKRDGGGWTRKEF